MSVALWPIAGAFLAAVGSAGLGWKLLTYRGSPGAKWFAATLGSQAVFCATVGVSYLVFDPALRELLETIAWTALAVQVVAFLAFTLSYSGRGHLVRTPWFRALFAFPFVISVVLATNRTHGLFWTNFRVESVLGLSSATYSAAPGGVAFVGLGLFLVGVAAVVLLDTAASYSLYRAESLAIVFSTIPPGLAEVMWLAEVGPYPYLNLMPLAFIPHVLADGYAVFATDIFEYNPTTRRVVDETAIDYLESPVVVVNPKGRVVDLNPAAADAFGTSKRAALKTGLDEVVGSDIDLAAADQTITARVDGVPRDFAVSPSEHVDPSGIPVGYSVLFQDVTVQRRREQRLDVFNRVLRHNIRNDLNVVLGNLELAREETELPTDGGRDRRLAAASRSAEKLLRLAEDARAVDRVVDRADVERASVRLRDVVSDAVATAGVEHAAAVEVNPDAVVETDARLLTTTAARLLSAIEEYVGGDVVIRLIDGVEAKSESGAGTDASFRRLEFRGSGPLPSHEVEAVEAGTETALTHASSLDLWVVRWGAELVGCELDFDGDATAALRLPTGGGR
ncbi:signal transduction histidine kinase regulating citrate/malate metabolism [Halogeometricum pallidum JCM 14848]|uniref:Signal transduction histidine kinase regulating citrate/malate metabolism n=1 Tax=Halogeometricum pallidum JCM 14848 TaxID=1227487 RepID=M0CYY0_HALPD|nr:histidine kinase N-terminal 7TM domain-containing protein [Halogeometricum pallidum]ELZ27084.1 signal transduction histidine kinase regulating citrate/malate metabolism [Halogeometricum pallidum JCM 14848]